MSFLDDWRMISPRIHGLNEAGKRHALLRPSAANSTGSNRFLLSPTEEIFEELRNFHRTHRDSLPTSTIALLEKANGLASTDRSSVGARGSGGAW
jgi:hypothetical protein